MTLFVIGGVATTHIESAKIQADSISQVESFSRDKNVALETPVTPPALRATSPSFGRGGVR